MSAANVWVDELEVEEAVLPRPARLSLVSTPNWRVDEIVRRTAISYGLSVEDLLGRSRSKMIVRARKEAMKAVYELGFSYPEVGRFFGRDHTTVMYLVKWKKAR